MSQSSRQIHGPSSTKSSGNGKKKISAKDKRRSYIGNYFSSTKLAEKDLKDRIRRRGGTVAARLKHAATASILTKDGYKKAVIRGVLESKDNRNFARQNIITKGTIINTDIGKASVINRPGREGTVIAKLLE
ncbi:30S ribosomal protein S8e [Candidatus Marsarchaeota archaeon]|nr:30S ribosomal protein S8e [Candidatus Marsarchaeota archaeon]MCL5405011.1 30S ribosomal protein S8e [Candidatus Marsarchaeota archaeon]